MCNNINTKYIKSINNRDINNTDINTNNINNINNIKPKTIKVLEIDENKDQILENLNK